MKGILLLRSEIHFPDAQRCNKEFIFFPGTLQLAQDEVWGTVVLW